LEESGVTAESEVFPRAVVTGDDGGKVEIGEEGVGPGLQNQIQSGQGGGAVEGRELKVWFEKARLRALDGPSKLVCGPTTVRGQGRIWNGPEVIQSGVEERIFGRGDDFVFDHAGRH
jgi:hypothetical protein